MSRIARLLCPSLSILLERLRLSFDFDSRFTNPPFASSKPGASVSHSFFDNQHAIDRHQAHRSRSFDTRRRRTDSSSGPGLEQSALDQHYRSAQSMCQSVAQLRRVASSVRLCSMSYYLCTYSLFVVIRSTSSRPTTKRSSARSRHKCALETPINGRVMLLSVCYYSATSLALH